MLLVMAAIWVGLNVLTGGTFLTPRNLFNLAIGTDNLWHSKNGGRTTLRFTLVNMTNKVALYNFLSTFSGTHFVPPRSIQLAIGYTF